MPTILTLPKIGINMTEAKIVEWLVKEGDYIEQEQAIIEAETDKATQEITSTDTGVLARTIAKPGDTIEIEKPIVILTKKE